MKKLAVCLSRIGSSRLTSWGRKDHGNRGLVSLMDMALNRNKLWNVFASVVVTKGDKICTQQNHKENAVRSFVVISLFTLAPSTST